jgi:hypothetical protein
MVSYSWTSTSITPFTSGNQNPSITNVTPNNSGDYTVTVRDANGCENSATTTVLVYDNLNGGTIGSDQTICYNGDPAAFSNVTSPTGGGGAWTYSWESKVGAGPWSAIGGANGLTYDVPAGLTQTTCIVARLPTARNGLLQHHISYCLCRLKRRFDKFQPVHLLQRRSAAFSNDAPASGGDGTFATHGNRR